MAGIINGAMTQDQTDTTPKVANMSDIQASYESLFGRPADDAGAAYWNDMATKNNWTADQLKANIGYNAQSQDQAAESSLNGGGSISKNWTQTGLNASDVGTKDTWDPTTNQWVAAKDQQPIYASSTSSPTASTYTPTLLGNPTQWNVTPQQTAAGLINQYTDPNSPIIQAARTRAAETMNDRGLLNSSMALTAADQAAYDAAIPLATNDAATYSKAAGYNADESNQFAVQNANYQNTASQFNANSENVLKGQILSSETQKQLAQMDSGTRTQLAQIEANYHQLMQSNASASDLYRQVAQNITNISMSKDLDADAKQAAVNNQIQLLQNGMQINGAISNLDLGSLLDFSVNANPESSPSSSVNATQSQPEQTSADWG